MYHEGNREPDGTCTPIEPAWKGFPEFKDVVPARKPTA